MTCGIYCFYLGTSEKPYIGKSINIGGRISTHKRLIKDNKDSKKICSEAKIYGNELHYYILQECNMESLDELEKYWIKEFNSIEEGLNSSEGGENWGGSGINGGNSKYSKEEIVQVLNYLSLGTYGYRDITKITQVDPAIVESIHKGKTHVWLKDYDIEKYTLMLSKVLPRSSYLKESFFIKNTSTNEIVEVFKLNETAAKLEISKQALSMVKNGIRKHTSGWYLYEKEG